MAKNCAMCEKKLGLLAPKYATRDGVICASCWQGLGLDSSPMTILKASMLTLNELMQIGNTQQAGSISQPPPPDPNTLVYAAPPQAEKKKDSDSVHDALMSTPSSPIDICVEISTDGQYSIACQGNPLFTFEDMVAGNEMVIGKGYVRNESDHDAVEIALECEFDPPIIDNVALVFQEGLFKAGEEIEFDIEDPPINLEEFAKIGVVTSGVVKMTLKLAEQPVGSFTNTMTIIPAPRDEMESLIGAERYRTMKNADGPAEVLLTAIKDGSYEIDILRNPQLLYSMYSNNQEQIIGDVHVINDTSKQLKNVKFEAKFSSNILAPISILLGNVEPGQAVNFEVDDPAIDVDKLMAITDIETCIATYSMSVGNKKVAETTSQVTICPYDQWNAALVMLPAYMTPNHPYIIRVLRQASDLLLEQGKNPSLEGYQGNASRVKEMVKAVYDALKSERIVYSNPPASFFGPQRIRLCTNVLENKFATCMDITLLFASCLESFGLNPLLITAPGHIFAGVWLGEEDHLDEPIISDPVTLKALIDNERIIALECTCMNAGKEETFEEAMKVSSKLISVMAEKCITSHDCLDVRIVRAMGIRPLPIRFEQPSEATISSSTKKTSSVAIEKESVKADQVKKKQRGEDKDEASEPRAKHTAAGVYTIEPYEQCELKALDISATNFYEAGTKSALKEIARQIIEVEAPISQPALVDAIVRATSLSKVTGKVSEYLDGIVTSVGAKITRQNGVRFFWNKGMDPEAYRIYRTQPQRQLDNLCKYEARNAVCYVIQENGPLTKEALSKELVKLFGYSRTSAKIDSAIASAIKAARDLKSIIQDTDGRFKDVL